MWEPEPLATLRASTACTEIILLFLLVFNEHMEEWKHSSIILDLGSRRW
jgi:hypothetical protein